MTKHQKAVGQPPVSGQQQPSFPTDNWALTSAKMRLNDLPKVRRAGKQCRDTQWEGGLIDCALLAASWALSLSLSLSRSLSLSLSWRPPWRSDTTGTTDHTPPLLQLQGVSAKTPDAI